MILPSPSTPTPGRRASSENKPNPGVLYDRALAYTATEQYDLALTDFDEALGLDQSRAAEVESAILGDQALADILRENSSEYPNLASSITIPEVSPTQPTPTPAATATPTLGIGSTIFLRKMAWSWSTCPPGNLKWEQ